MKKKSILRNIFITLLALVSACAISLIFQRLEVQEHITTIFVFSVFLVSLFNDGYFYGIFSSVAGTVAINFAFTYPFLEFDFLTPVNVISAIIMLAIAVITGMLTTKIKTYEETKAESEREKARANLLRAVSHDLRTPLTSIYSASSLLRDEKETLTEELQGIKSAATNRSEKAFHNAIPKDAFRKASVITLLAVALVSAGTWLMAILESEISLMDALFEVTSAFGTVGLSTGITTDLGVGAKLLSISIMYIGRLGPLTVASLWYFSRGEHISFPEGNISIG